MISIRHMRNQSSSFSKLYVSNRTENLNLANSVSWFHGSILFNATASGRLPENQCGISAAGCSRPAPPPEVMLEMADLSWKTSPGPIDRGPPLPWV